MYTSNINIELLRRSFDGQEVTDDGQRFVIRNDDQTIAGYYEVTQRISATAKSNSSNNLDTQTLEVKNTYHPTNTITISANKKWSDEAHQLKGVVVQLQRKAEGANPTDWEAYPDDDTSKQTLDSKNNWTCSWSDLPNQQIHENNNITKYTYQVVEVGVQNGDSTVNFGDQVQSEQKFAVETDGYYQIDYSTVDSWVNDTNSLDANGTIYITNTYRSVATASITPQKVWKDDSAYASQRPEVTFELQQKIGDGEWQSLHGELQDGVFVVDESKDAYRVTLNSQNQVSWSDSTWELAMITGLPEKVLTVNSANGTYTETYCSYRFVEVVTVDGQEQILADGGEFNPSYTGTDGIVEGKYTISINGGTVTNTFKESTGILKNILDKNGNSINTITKDDLDTWPTMTVEGEEYYVFNWIIEFEVFRSESINDIQSPVIDVLPEGFSLCTDSTKNGNPSNLGPGGYIDPDDIVATSDVMYQVKRAVGDYYPSPLFIWRTYYAVWMSENTEANLWEMWDQNDRYYYDSRALRKTIGNWVYKDADGNEYTGSVLNPELVGKNIVIFNKPYNSASLSPIIAYSTKIKCSELDAKVEKGSYTFSNDAERYTVDTSAKEVTATGYTASASLTITNTQNRGLITKDYSATLIPGYIQYSLDVNRRA